MSFDTYLNQAWNDHVDHSLKVAEEFPKGLELATTADHLSQLIGLVTHVMGEHLGEYKKGVEVLRSITKHSAFSTESETDKAIQRSIAALLVAAGENVDLKSFSLSDHIRVLAVAASALADRDANRAQELLVRSLKLSEMGLDKKDPANRSLAVTGNNLASALEEKKDRSNAQTELMIFAAQTARKYWEIAGTWSQVGYAEYRLAMSYLQAQLLDKAHEHAQKSLTTFEQNNAGNMDLFYGNQALALIAKEKKALAYFKDYSEKAKQHFEKMSADDKAWCEKDLKSLG